MRPESQRGFTLIEMLIVVVVIGILAAIAIARYNDVRADAIKATLLSDLKSVSASQELHHMKNLTYGGTTAAIDARLSEGVEVTIGEASATGWSATATHPAVGSETCAVYYGRAAAVAPATQPGLVACSF